MSNEIQKAQSNLPALTAEDYGYEKEISAEGLQLPILKLCQKASMEQPTGAKPGDFYNATTGKVYGPKIVLNIFKSFRGRIKFAPNYKMECKSADGKTGTNMTGETKECATCPYSSWKTDPQERKDKYCPPVITFLALAEGDFVPGLLGLSKTREKTANKINSQLHFVIAENRNLPEGQRTPVYFYKVELTSTMIVVNNNQVYEIDAKMAGKETDPARQGILVQLFREWRAFENNMRVVEAEAAPKTEETTF